MQVWGPKFKSPEPIWRDAAAYAYHSVSLTGRWETESEFWKLAGQLAQPSQSNTGSKFGLNKTKGEDRHPKLPLLPHAQWDVDTHTDIRHTVTGQKTFFHGAKLRICDLFISGLRRRVDVREMPYLWPSSTQTFVLGTLTNCELETSF